MTDEDLNALHNFLLAMKPDALIQIGVFNCAAMELYAVVREAKAFRAMLALREASR